MALTERLQLLIEATGIGAISEFRKVGSAAESELSRADRGTKDSTGVLNSALNKMGFQSISAGTALKLGLAAGATAAGVEAIHLGENYLRATEEVRKFSEITGASAEDASKLRNATKALGIDIDSVSGLFLRFTRNIATTPQTLSDFGVAVAKTKDGTTDVVGTLENVSEALRHIPDPARRAQLETAAFGIRGVAPLLPLLAQGKQGIEDLSHTGPIFTAGQLQSAQQFQIATREVHNQLSKLGNFLGGVVITSASGYAMALDRITGGHGRAAASAEVHASAEAQLATTLSAAQTKLISAVQSENSARSARANADYAVGQAQQSLNDAQSNLNDLLRKGAVDANAVASAQDSLAQSERGVTTATRSLADARANLNRVVAEAPEDRAKAGLGVSEAGLGITDADLAVKAARRGVSQAASSGDSLQVAQAREALKHALLGQQQAAFALTDAQKALNDSQDAGAGVSAKVKAAQDQVTSAEDQLMTAEQGRESSLRALHTAEVGNVSFSKEVRSAREAVASATHGVATAEDAAANAAESLGLAQMKGNEALNAGLALGSQLAAQLEVTLGMYPGLRPLLDQLEGILNPNAGRAGISTSNSGPNANFMGPVIRDSISVAPPGFFTGYNATGKPETLVNASMSRGGGGGGGQVIFNFPNFMGDKNDLQRLMQEALLKWQGRGGKLGFN